MMMRLIQIPSQRFLSAMSMNHRAPTAGTHAMAIITAQATENARPGAGATVTTTVTEHPSLTSAPSTKAKMRRDQTSAITPWSATVTEPALSGAGARANLTADLRMSIYFIITHTFQ